jgi:hypothetical protein
MSGNGVFPRPEPGADESSNEAVQGLERAYAVLNEQPARALEFARPAKASGQAPLVGRALALEARVAIRRGDLERALAVLLEASLLAGRDAPDLIAEVAVASARLTF